MRKAFKLFVNPDAHEEYTRRHQPIWKDLEQTLIEHGVRNYSIFLDAETNTLFGYAEIASEERWNEIAQTEVCGRWWKHMAEIMPTNADGSPVSVELKEVFHIEA